MSSKARAVSMKVLGELLGVSGRILFLERNVQRRVSSRGETVDSGGFQDFAGLQDG